MHLCNFKKTWIIRRRERFEVCKRLLVVVKNNHNSLTILHLTDTNYKLQITWFSARYRLFSVQNSIFGKNTVNYVKITKDKIILHCQFCISVN